MTTAIIIADGVKQIMFTPENDADKEALRMITMDDDITIEYHTGTLFDHPPSSALGYIVQPSTAGYLRGYKCPDSLMLVLKPKQKK